MFAGRPTSVPFTHTVPEDKRKALSDQIDALSQSLSQVPGLVLQQ